MIVALAVLIIARTHGVHRRREEVEQAAEVFNLRKIKDAGAAIEVTFEHTGIFLREVREILDLAFVGLFEQNRQTLKSARTGQRKIQRWSNIIAANIFKVFRLLHWQDVQVTQRYSGTISSLQEISESVRDVVLRANLHVANNHSGLLEEQIAELDQIRGLLMEILDTASLPSNENTERPFLLSITMEPGSPPPSVPRRTLPQLLSVATFLTGTL